MRRKKGEISYATKTHAVVVIILHSIDRESRYTPQDFSSLTTDAGGGGLISGDEGTVADEYAGGLSESGLTRPAVWLEEALFEKTCSSISLSRPEAVGEIISSRLTMWVAMTLIHSSYSSLHFSASSRTPDACDR